MPFEPIMKELLDSPMGERVIVTYTTYTDNPLINDSVFDIVQKIGQKLKYDVIKIAQGDHKKSTRPHFHTMVVYQLTLDSKKYKTLNKKLQSELKLYKELDEIETHISFIYKTEESKKHKNKKIYYDETSLQYCYKEYSKDTDINYHNQLGLCSHTITGMRKTAHAEWLRAQAQKEKFEKNENDKKEFKEGLYIYLGNKYNLKDLDRLVDLKNYNYEDLKRKIAKDVITYYNNNDKLIDINMIKKQTITWLVKNELVDLGDLIIFERI